MINFITFIKSLKYAVSGLKFVWRENNFKIQVIISVVIFFLMYLYDLSRLEKVALVIVIFSVLILESLNTIFEHLTDILKPRLHSYVKIIKDIMASIVLLASIGSIIIGLMIFWPYIFK